MGILQNFMQDMGGVEVKIDQQDRWLCKPNKQSFYTLKHTYCELQNLRWGVNYNEAFSEVWKPTKALYLACRILHGRLPTK